MLFWLLYSDCVALSRKYWFVIYLFGIPGKSHFVHS